MDIQTGNVLCYVRLPPKPGKRSLKGYEWLPMRVGVTDDNVHIVGQGSRHMKNAIHAGKLFVVNDIYNIGFPVRRYFESSRTWNEFRARRVMHARAQDRLEKLDYASISSFLERGAVEECTNYMSRIAKRHHGGSVVVINPDQKRGRGTGTVKSASEDSLLSGPGLRSSKKKTGKASATI
jgi:hypothetical protein